MYSVRDQNTTNRKQLAEAELAETLLSLWRSSARQDWTRRGGRDITGCIEHTLISELANIIILVAPGLNVLLC